MRIHSSGGAHGARPAILMPPAGLRATVIDGYIRLIGRAMTADLRALYPHEIEDQAVVRSPTRARSASHYERARLAAGALTACVPAVRRLCRLGSRSLPHTGAVPAGPPPRSRRDRRDARAERSARREQEQTTDVATVEETRRAIEAMAAKPPGRHQGTRRRPRHPAATHPGGTHATAPHPAARRPARARQEHTRWRSRMMTPDDPRIEAAALAAGLKATPEAEDRGAEEGAARAA